MVFSNDPALLAKSTSQLTIAAASSKPKLLRLVKSMGDQTVLDLLTILVTDVRDFFNLPADRNMKDNQITFTAQAMIEDYKHFSIEDFGLCFKNGKLGKYGKNFSTFDGQIIIGWLKSYDLERDEVFVHENKIDTPKEPILPKVIIQDLYEKFSAPLEQDKKSKEEEYKKLKQEWLRKNAQSNPGTDKRPPKAYRGPKRKM